jgi:hypothetical protein
VYWGVWDNPLSVAVALPCCARGKDELGFPRLDCEGNQLAADQESDTFYGSNEHTDRLIKNAAETGSTKTFFLCFGRKQRLNERYKPVTTGY